MGNQECTSGECISHELCVENKPHGNGEVPMSGRIDQEVGAHIKQVMGLSEPESFSYEMDARASGSTSSSVPPLFPKGQGPAEFLGAGNIGIVQKLQTELEHSQQMLMVANSSWRRAEARARDEKALGEAMFDAGQDRAKEKLLKILSKDAEIREAEKALSEKRLLELESKAAELQEANARLRVMEATFKHLKEAGLDPGLVGSMIEDGREFQLQRSQSGRPSDSLRPKVFDICSEDGSETSSNRGCRLASKDLQRECSRHSLTSVGDPRRRLLPTEDVGWPTKTCSASAHGTL